MARITVGQQYSKEFESIVRLFNGGFLSEKTNIRRAEQGLIETTEHSFELGGSARVEASSAQKIDRRGASWFSVFRGERVDDSNSAWIELIENVAKDYRTNYSFIEFKQEKDASQKKEDHRLVQRLFDKVLSQIYVGCTLSEEACAPEVVNIFGLSMKLELGGGVGQSEPVLCKVYFRQINGEFVPLSKEQAFEIENYINGAVPDEGDSAQQLLGKEQSDLISSVLAALTACIEDNPDTQDNSFTDYVIFSGQAADSSIIADANDVVKKDTDFNKVKFMLKMLGNSTDKQLSCSKVEILGISHVKWDNSVFQVKQGGKPVLSVTVGINNSIDVRCINCGDESSLLIDANEIRGINGFEKIYWTLDPSKDDFGLSESIANITKHSEFSRHLFTVDCTQATLDGCRRTVCSCQVFEVGKELKCKNCHHPEIVYVDIFDQDATPKSTYSLEFAMDKLSFVDSSKDELFTCPCCHHSYTQDTVQKFGLCEHCASTEVDEEGKRKYKLYSKMLNPLTRLTHLFSTKTCKEYHGMIIFALGKDRYIFDRLSASERGLIKGPTKYKRR